MMEAAADAGLSFVPRVHRDRGNASCVSAGGRLWDLTTWLPGAADYHAAPTPARLIGACRAVAQLHLAWECFGERTVYCPAVDRRLTALREWRGLVGAGWRPAWRDGELDGWARQGWRHVERLELSLPYWLMRCTTQVPVQPCLCDVWHDHLLFVGECLTGLVDYGEVKVDHVAVDLARLLGDLVGDDEGGWQTGLAAYRELRPFPADAEELARVLDRSGVVLGAATWLRRLYHEGRRYDEPAVVRRLKTLVTRMDRWG
jgi:homoserine kinase type II